MAPSYKLTYFDTRGIAEPIRFLLKYGEVDFEDVRIKKEDWPSLKHNFPFGHVPVLEHNGKQLYQSVAICRYLGKILNLAGKDEWEDSEIDAIVDTFKDCRHKCAPAARETDEEKKNIAKEAALNEIVPYYFSRFEEILQKNNGYLALGRLTWADLYVISLYSGYNKFAGGNIFGKYPNLQALKERVEALPAIRKWIEVRPKGDD